MGKKKRSNKGQNEKASSCEGCSVKLDKRFVYCKCTRVRFCSETCERDRPHDGCPGCPEVKMDLYQRLPEPIMQRAMKHELENNEFQDSVHLPFIRYASTKIPQMGHPSNFDVWDLANLADEGETVEHRACMFLAAVRFKHRVLGTPRLRGDKLMNDNAKANIPVLESQDLAFRYFEKAAKLGHGLAMQSLANCFGEGIGCRENHRRCIQWLWRACLNQSDGAIDSIDRKALLPKDVLASIKNVEMMMLHKPPNQREIVTIGPNLGSLVLALHPIVEKEGYSLPPFAGAWATATVNNSPVNQHGRPRTPLIGSYDIRKFVEKVRLLKAQGVSVKAGYARRGTAKQATAMCHANSPSSSRAKDNQLFLIPPRALCDERVTDEELAMWQAQMLMAYHEQPVEFLVAECVHSEMNQSHAFVHCPNCAAEARLRLEAVSRGSVALSIDEALDDRGQAAIYRNNDNDDLKTETWKNYGVGEAECALAVLVASGISAYVAPIFIAQDPNLYWPLIADHGCIRAALEFVAPHIDWDANIGCVKRPLDNVPIVSGCRPRQCLRKCGHNLCTSLHAYEEKQYLCSGCERRRYCSEKCQRDDWNLHKLECRKVAETNPRVDSPENVEEDKKETLKYDLKFQVGDDAVIHDLKAKTQYNGMVGLVGDSDENGRIALTLRSNEGAKQISIKPENLHHIGVFCRKRKKKSRVFECMHGLEVCSSCYFDFTLVNQLCRLKYSGNDIASSFATDSFNDAHFASCVPVGGDGCTSMKDDWPVECHGMENHVKQRDILKALLDTKTEMTVNAQVAKTAFITFGGLKHPILRAYTDLDTVARLL